MITSPKATINNKEEEMMAKSLVPRLRRTLLAMLVALVVAAPSVEAQEILDDPDVVEQLLEGPTPERFVPGEVIVKLKEGRSAAAFAPAATAMNLDTQITETSGGEFVYRIPPSVAGAMNDTDLREQTLAVVEEMNQNDDVLWAQPNYYYYIAATPTDPLYSRQWHYFDNGHGAGQSPGGINLPKAWDTGTGNASVVVAVIDTGILPNHPDVSGSPNLVSGFDMISNTFVANDGDGRDSDPTDPGDAIAAGECAPGSPARPNSWHGSHVAGTVGVVGTNNGTGIAGTNWSVSLQAVRVLGKCGGLSTDINDAIRWAAGLPVPGIANNPTPADVINMSLGGSGACSPAAQSAINDAVGAGTTVVVAAGNSNSDANGFRPANCSGVITVAASDYNGKLSRFSNFGATIEILAPGGDVRQDADNDGNPDGVLSIVDGGYAYYNGTSMAAPHVAGVAALWLAGDPGLTPATILSELQANAIPRDTTHCPSAKPCGAGLLNAARGGARVVLSPESVAIDAGDSAAFTATVTAGGSPLPGVSVSFASDKPAVATVPGTALTNAGGVATVTVTAVASGSAKIKASAQGASDESTVKVPADDIPAGSVWGFVLLSVLALYLLRRRVSPAGQGLQ